ncbi:MAG: ABC transporter permease, partial [Gemmatimonadales bacterium]
MRSLAQDLHFTLRSLRRRPLFTAVAIATMALGIGATTSIYSIVDGVLLRPLPFRESGRLVQVQQIFYDWEGNPVFGKMWDRIPLGVDEFEILRDRNTVFSSVGIWNGTVLTLAEPGGGRQELRGTRVSASMLGVLGERTVRGRDFNPGEDVVGGPKLALIGYEFWRKQFGATDDAIGKFLAGEEDSYEIVGVLPPGLALEQRSSPADFWILAGQDPNDRGHGNRSYSGVARLKPGVTMERADAATKQILSGRAEQGRKGVRLADWKVEQTRDVRTPLFVLLGAVALLLGIACINVAMLLLGEASRRSQEMAARVALGAGRARLVRQLLTESVLLACIGTAVGTLVAWGATKGLVAAAPPQIPGLAGVRVDLRVLAFAAMAALGTGLLFGLAPALALSRVPAGVLLRAGAGNIIAGRGGFQRALVAVELTLSFLLLVGAGLFSRSLDKLSAVHPGFRAESLLVVNFGLPATMRRDTVRTRQVYHDVVERLSAVPGVVTVTASNTPPFAGGSSSSSNEIEGRPLAPGTRGPEAQQRAVMPGYFQAMGIPLVAGRAFDERDQSGAELVAVISETMAKRDWPGEQALGKHVKHQGVWRSVVGIVGDIKFRALSSNDEATLYTPYAQRHYPSVAILVRTRVPPATLTAQVKAGILAVAPAAIVQRVDVMSDLVRRSFANERFRTLLVSLFGVLAALLAAVGLYGVTARAVGQRTREVAIRVALGSSATAVVALMVRSTLGGVGIGIACGMAIAIMAAPWASPLLFGVNSRDPVTYAAIVALVSVVSVVASWIPARRAARVQPAMVLRGE